MASKNRNAASRLNTAAAEDTIVEENRAFDSETLDTDEDTLTMSSSEAAGLNTGRDTDIDGNFDTGITSPTTMTIQSAGTTDDAAFSGAMGTTPVGGMAGASAMGADLMGGSSTGMGAGTSNFNTSSNGSALEGAKDQAEGIKDQAKEKAKQAVDTTKQVAGQALGKVKDQAVSQISTQKDRAAESLTGITSALHQTGETFRGANQNMLADYVDSFAGQVDKLTDYVRGRSVEELARDVEGFARHNPALFVGGAFLLGAALARFLKSSSTYDTIPRNQALVPVSPSPVNPYDMPAAPMGAGMHTGNLAGRLPGSGGQATVNAPGAGTADVALESPKVRDEFGDRPVTAHDYVPGIGVSSQSGQGDV